MENEIIKVLNKVMELNKSGLNIKFELTPNQLWLWQHQENSSDVKKYTSINGLENTDQYYTLLEFLEGAEADVRT